MHLNNFNIKARIIINSIFLLLKLFEYFSLYIGHHKNHNNLITDTTYKSKL